MVIIIGAGPAGLSVGYQLQKRNIDYLILEKDVVGNSWRNHYDTLSLHTLKQVSSLPGLDYPDSTPNFPTRADFATHQQAYAKQFRLNIREGVAVTQLTHNAQANSSQRWTVSTSEGDLQAASIVIASGIWSNPITPNFQYMEQFMGNVVHAQQYKNAAPFIGQKVLVVGVGNTGADIAVELAEAGIETSIAIKVGADFVPYPTSANAMRFGAWLFRTLPKSLGNRLLKRPDFADIGLPGHPLPPTEAYPVVGFKLPDAIRNGKIKTYPGLKQFYREGVCFDDGQTVPFDSVIMATGYRPALDFAGSDLVKTDQRGWPIVDAQYRSVLNKDLFMAGFEYPATSGWVQNMRRVSAIIGRNIRP